ncbi:MAG: hypothetical protein SPJ62_02805 [Inconstantimicrobium porci]|uniref:Uncharacterized protein n=1 Tax=Inconstantimicrobium porci TaxID=2652291 RepID=A0A7X2T163_9CLOT|nr:hypothetical protein [Inconstantimicrobium porci]MDD6771541.1 hypothetical protein [Inconstantimicrobium porci]MDY5910943.1 hypothetical protein [Inconstantimicrobium porci]MSR90900.1 hypothetical protein [Inconstantimicrobium porci]
MKKNNQNKRCLEINSTIEYIFDWYNKKNTKLLNVITYPYNDIRIFRDLIVEVSQNSMSVLYLCNNENKYSEIIKYIRNAGTGVTYSKIKNGNSGDECIINFSSIDNIVNIKKYYDLIIIDDISMLSPYSSTEFKEYVDMLYRNCGKIILYTFEEIMNNVDTIYVGNYFRTKPFIEPRVITTRIDLNTDIPFVMYDYIRWFKKNRRKILIITPSGEKQQMVYDYYVKRLNIVEKMKVIKYERQDHDKICRYAFENKDNAVIIVSDRVLDDFIRIPDLDIVVYFSNDECFTYKKLVYLCGEVGGMNKEGEVLLLSNGVNDNIDQAKECARQYNKISWEKGLLT